MLKRQTFLSACLVVAIAFLIALVMYNPSWVLYAQSDQRCFVETDQCISGRIREFWEQNGSVYLFGLPITPQRAEMIEGRPIQVQWFERNRLELHPENAQPYDVQVSRLGADYVSRAGPPSRDAPQNGCRYFEETGFNLCEPFLRAWRANGLELDRRPGKTEAENLALFGLPLTGVYPAVMADGKEYLVQWFERARFEYHPENVPPYNVLLGQLGSEAVTSTTEAPSPAATPPTSATVCLSQPELELTRLLNDHRAAYGLPSVPSSVSLTQVAQAHVVDLHENRPDSGTDSRGLPCTLQSWSDKGIWSPVCYTSDHAYAEGMWNKPREITGNRYPGNGYEIAFSTSPGQPATATEAIASWISSPEHNAVLLEQGVWAGTNWSAMGIGIYEEYAVVWLGREPDAQGMATTCP